MQVYPKDSFHKPTFLPVFGNSNDFRGLFKKLIGPKELSMGSKEKPKQIQCVSSFPLII